MTTSPNPRRRNFLKAATIPLCLPKASWVLAQNTPTPGRLVVIFLRGGMDGLFAIAPVSAPQLAELRPSLAREVLANGLPLGNSGFSAHPACRPLAELYEHRELAFAPCFGTTDHSRSHFQAQDVFELGTGQSSGPSGWLARAAQAAGNRAQVIGFAANQALILQGESRIELMPLSGSSLQMRQDKGLAAIRAMHKGRASGEAIEHALNTQAMLDEAGGMDPKAARGASGVGGFPQTAESMARILRGNPLLSMAFIDLGGFDTHAAEENALNRSLPKLCEGLLALRNGLGSAEWARTQVLLCSEFGRTVRENGTQGTDHGHGGLACVIGGSLAGGRMIGDFPGLEARALNENRDLPVTVDWRHLIGRLLRETQGFNRAALEQVLPGLKQNS